MKKNKLIIGIVLLVSIFIEVFFVYGWQISYLNQRAKRCKDLQQKIETFNKEILRQKEMNATKERLQGEALSLESIYLNPRDLPYMLSALGEPAKTCKIKIDTTKLMDREDIGLSYGYSFFYLPVEMKMRGAYHQVGRYINLIENGEVPLKVKSLRVSGEGKDLNVEAVIMGAAKEEKLK